MSAWKQFEREAAALFGGKRFWANSGERLDFDAGHVFGQCKLVKTLSLNSLSALAEEMEDEAKDDRVGVVCVKVRRGCGQRSSSLVVMTFSMLYRLMHDDTIASQLAAVKQELAETQDRYTNSLIDINLDHEREKALLRKGYE